ncbi:MAG: FAD-binding oxidoreductase [Alphaproteobacteria bacterium]|nr:FAD-binding oxidoreductase [Alphaproteobacteria bacterium]
MTDTVVLTPEKCLRTGRSVWSDTRHPQLKTHALRGPLQCDVAIVGAGISGAFMAEALSRHYGKVVVLDRRAPAMGSTHASTAMLQYEIDTPLTELADKIGHPKAARAWRRSFAATQDLTRLVRAENIPCGLQDRSALYLTGDEMGARGMEKEARARNRAGLACEFLSGRELKARFGIARTGAIFSDGAAVADPVALARGLLRRARTRGTKIFAPCEVSDVMASARGVMLNAGGWFVEAKAVVFCTGYEVLKGLPQQGSEITSSWAAATAPHADYPGWLDQTLVWEAASPYLYLRTGAQGQLIVGGEDADLDSPSYRAGTLDIKARKLAQKTSRLLPGLKPEWTHVWAGAFGESSDGLPSIDSVPGLPHCFAVMGFGGNGTVYSMIAAQLMPGLIKGRPARDAELFAFRQKT